MHQAKIKQIQEEEAADEVPQDVAFVDDKELER